MRTLLWGMGIAILCLSACAPEKTQEESAISLELTGITRYSGKNAWKNKVFLALNRGLDPQHPSFVQAFDYFETERLQDSLSWKADSLIGRLSFSLPKGRGYYPLAVFAARKQDSIFGNFRILSGEQKGVAGKISGKLSDTLLQKPQLQVLHAPFPAFPKPPAPKATVADFADRGKQYAIVDYGAKVDTESGAAIQQAIDACHQAGGGTVRVPPGRFISGALEIKSQVVLWLEQGSELLASTDSSAYPKGYFLYAEHAKNCGIAGPGVINGNAFHWVDTLRIEYPNRKNGKRLFWKKDALAFWPTVIFKNCEDVFFCDFEIRNSPSFHLTPFQCKRVSIRGITLNTPINLVRADGIDPIGSSEVQISDCRIQVGDDAICLKGHDQWKGLSNALPTHHIWIDNCVISTSCNAIKTGTESQRDMHHLWVKNCKIYNHPDSDLKAESVFSFTAVDGGKVHDIFVDSVEISGVHSPIFLRLGRRNKRNPDGKSALGDVFLSHIQIDGADQPISLHGLPELRIGKVSLQDIQVNLISELPHVIPDSVPLRPKVYPNADRFGVLPAWGLYARYVDSLALGELGFSNVHLERRDTVVLEEVGIVGRD